MRIVVHDKSQIEDSKGRKREIRIKRSMRNRKEESNEGGEY
jgi:hypothetical protein